MEIYKLAFVLITGELLATRSYCHELSAIDDLIIPERISFTGYPALLGNHFPLVLCLMHRQTLRDTMHYILLGLFCNPSVYIVTVLSLGLTRI